MIEKVRTYMTEKFLAKIWWALVVIAALSISTWSLYTLGIHEGMPKPIAALISLCFDGGAIAASDLSLKWARIHGVSGLSARMAMMSFAGMSAWFNYNHAVILGLPLFARFMFASPPVIAVTTIELHLRFEHRTALKKSGSLPGELPHYAKWAWIFRPVKTLNATLWHVDRQIDRTLNAYIPGEIDADIPHKVVRAWAIREGRDVTDRGPLPRSLILEYMARELPSGGKNDENAA